MTLYVLRDGRWVPALELSPELPYYLGERRLDFALPPTPLRLPVMLPSCQTPYLA